MMFRKIVVLGVVLVLFFMGAKCYLGYHYFYRYGEARNRAENIERSFPKLETRIKIAVRFWGNPLFYLEMGQLYLERALAENQFGTAVRRDFYLDRARESLIRAIKGNPVDAFAFFEMGKVYMLYNFPLLTYMGKAKRYFRKAVELKPADEFLNENIVYIYLTQWERLEDEEKGFVKERVEAMKENNRDFVQRLRRRWREDYGGLETLEKILRTIDNK
jgi:tetratricopeptide (TPR) repeat protein